MVIKKVRLHTCENAKETSTKIEGYIEGTCRCRKWVTPKRAAELVDDGVAQYVATSYSIEGVERTCRVCGGHENFKNRCQECGNTGVVLKQELVVERGEDIYMRPFLRTPRTATVEAKHVGYAFDGVSLLKKALNRAAQRIEEYHTLDQLSLAQLGAELRDVKTGEILIKGKPEPENDPKTATGEKYDYGRTI